MITQTLANHNGGDAVMNTEVQNFWGEATFGGGNDFQDSPLVGGYIFEWGDADYIRVMK